MESSALAIDPFLPQEINGTRPVAPTHFKCNQASQIPHSLTRRPRSGYLVHCPATSGHRNSAFPQRCLPTLHCNLVFCQSNQHLGTRTRCTNKLLPFEKSVVVVQEQLHESSGRYSTTNIIPNYEPKYGPSYSDE